MLNWLFCFVALSLKLVNFLGRLPRPDLPAPAPCPMPHARPSPGHLPCDVGLNAVGWPDGLTLAKNPELLHCWAVNGVA